MAYQNINQYNFKKWFLLDRSEIQDFSLSSDERDYKEEVIFSPNIIAYNDGNKLPFSFDLDNSNNSELFVLRYNTYNPYNNLISSNYYNPNSEDLNCYLPQTICDIGLTGTDNGLVTQMTGETITATMGLLSDSQKFDRLSFDRRLKLHQITGYTETPNIRFSGLPKDISYNIVSKEDPKIGVFHELYGGFYQGFYKLFGYEYTLYPERVNKGWSVEVLLKPRFVDEFTPPYYQTTLNNFYPNNKDIFFYLGTRAENKYYHHANGSPVSDSGYTRVTETLTCLKTCACSSTAITNSNCIEVYQPSDEIKSHELTCDCGCKQTEVTLVEPDKDPKMDDLSNALAFKLCGDPHNPQIGVRILRFTGDCVTTGSCSTTGITYETGYTVDNLCTTKGIYDFCKEINPSFLSQEHWVQLDLVWERYSWFDTCDLWYKGGLGLITKDPYIESLTNKSVNLISPPYTNGEEIAKRIEVVKLNERWLIEKDYRKGKIKIYVNGRYFHTFENIEEIIPRGLNTEKERQVGVPYNISWGGGTQGLHNNLTFTGCPESLNGLVYMQDPECFPNNILSGTTYSGLTTNILLEQNFAGSFDGGISQFRMYTEPLSADEVKHNFLLLKDKFDLFDFDCPNCDVIIPVTTTTTTNNFTTTTTTNNFTTTTTTNNFTTTTTTYQPTQTPTPTATQSPTPTPTQTPTPTLEPLNLTLFVEYFPGSIIASYTLVLNRLYSEEINTTFENVLNLYSGSPITIFTGVTVSSGSLSGQTIVTIDEDYNNYTGVSFFSQLSGAPIGSTYEIIVIPTPTPTITPTITPTPTPTETPIPTCIDTWMTENFNGTTFRNGDIIPQSTNQVEWYDATTNESPSWCYYNFDSNNGTVYGKLYNWFVVGDSRGVGPNGYIVPSEDDYTSLENCLGGNLIAGGKMKTTGTTEDNTGLWDSPNAGATNESRFSGTPNGVMSDGGVSTLLNRRGGFWTSTEISGGSVMVMNLNYGRTDVYHGPDSKGKGYSIRLKQGIPPTPTPTPTPTITPTPPEELINPLIVGNDEYLSVGDNEYLEF